MYVADTGRQTRAPGMQARSLAPQHVNLLAARAAAGTSSGGGGVRLGRGGEGVLPILQLSRLGWICAAADGAAALRIRHSWYVLRIAIAHAHTPGGTRTVPDESTIP